jgi:hypothetical protein
MVSFFKIIIILTGVKCYLNVVLICIFLIVMMSIFSYTCWSFAYLWRNPYSNL